MSRRRQVDLGVKYLGLGVEHAHRGLLPCLLKALPRVQHIECDVDGILKKKSPFAGGQKPLPRDPHLFLDPPAGHLKDIEAGGMIERSTRHIGLSRKPTEQVPSRLHQNRPVPADARRHVDVFLEVRGADDIDPRE